MCKARPLLVIVKTTRQSLDLFCILFFILYSHGGFACARLCHSQIAHKMFFNVIFNDRKKNVLRILVAMEPQFHGGLGSFPISGSEFVVCFSDVM